jgi:hypothetical protein
LPNGKEGHQLAPALLAVPVSIVVQLRSPFLQSCAPI